MSKETFSYKATPKGLLIMSNGGFKNYEKTNELYSKIVEYLKDNNLSITIINDELEFIRIKKTKSLFSRIFNR